MWRLRLKARTRNNHRDWPNGLVALIGLLVGLFANAALAADSGFSGGVTPSRFELGATQGDLLRKSLKIYNLSNRPQQYAVRTVEWRYSAAGEISFHDELAQDSCREWVRLERHKINVLPDPQRPRNFRFEVEIPEAAAHQECRFALMIENLDGAAKADFAGGSVSMPIAGRIAVIVYIGVGEAESELVIGEVSIQELHHRNVPTVTVKNLGNAHGRLDADLVAISESGKKTPLTIATSPILPGQTRFMALTPVDVQTLDFPLTVTGTIYSDGQTIKINQELRSANRGIYAER